MTPELKTACELVFQEHKISAEPIKWNKDAFHGRISIGLSEMAKQTLVNKKIIILPNKTKKVFTQLNPEVFAASSFEEAEKMVGNKIQAPVIHHTADTTEEVPSFSSPVYTYTQELSLQNVAQDQIQAIEIKWYMKPVFFYVIWPLCAALAGAVIPWLMDLAYAKLFLDPK